MIFFIYSILLLIVGCDNESVNNVDPGRSDSLNSSESFYSRFSEPSLLNESSSSVQNNSSFAKEIESSSSLMPQGCTESPCVLHKTPSSSSLTVICGEMIDGRDGQSYKTVTVGNMVTWMAENLKYAYLQPTLELDSSSWCYENLLTGCDAYGRLYLWSAMMDSAAIFSEKSRGCGYYTAEDEWQKCSNENVRGVCPEGWRLPTYNDYVELMSWRTLYSYDACKEGFFAFDELQLNMSGMNGGCLTTTSFWLLGEKDYAHGISDNYDIRSLKYSEGASIIDLYTAEKTQFHAVRCVRNFQMEK